MHKNKQVWITMAVVVVLLALAVVFAIKNNKNKGYSVVYVSTGEIYIGKLNTFPQFSLKDVYILQANKDPNDPAKNTFKLNPISDALWSTNSMHFIKDNVVFYGPILDTSVIAKKLAEQGK